MFASQAALHELIGTPFKSSLPYVVVVVFLPCWFYFAVRKRRRRRKKNAVDKTDMAKCIREKLSQQGAIMPAGKEEAGG